MKKLVFMAALLMMTAACFRQEIQTFDISVPQMKTMECARLIQEALLRVDGIKAAQPDLQKQVIAVTYDSEKLSRKNVEFAIADAGFTANDIPANAQKQAALPVECRP